MLQINKIWLNILIIMLCWVTGFLLVFEQKMLFVVNTNTLASIDLTRPLINYFNNFIEILLNNLTVALILCLGGYVSFGIISVFVSLYNGFILAIFVNSFLSKYNIDLLYKVMLHAPTEFLALCYFGAIGIKGFSNLKKIINKQDFIFFNLLLPLKRFIIPILLIFFSSIIESDLLFVLIKKIETNVP